MTIRNPRNQRPRKSLSTAPSMGITTIGTNPPSLDEPLPRFPRRPVPGLPGMPDPQPPAPTPPPATPAPPPPPVLYPEPGPAPVGPPTMGIGPVPTAPTPIVPGGPTMGIGPVPTAPTPIVANPGGPDMSIMPVPGTPMPKPVPGTPGTPGGPDMGIPGGPGSLNPQPRPLYPEGPNAGIPGGPGSGQTPPPGWLPGQPLPPGFGLDFMRNITPNELVNNQLNALLNSNSPYMQNARQRGMEFAASRGNLNSSIAAGASQRSALEAAMPIAQADAQAYRDANAANFDALSQLRQMRVAGDIENWLSDQNFNREFNGRLAMMPIQSSLDMMQYIAQRAMEDPAVYTPDVMSGFQNFFQQNLFNIMQQYFGEQTPPGGT